MKKGAKKDLLQNPVQHKNNRRRLLWTIERGYYKCRRENL
jgi:hypothetical protein